MAFMFFATHFGSLSKSRTDKWKGWLFEKKNTVYLILLALLPTVYVAIQTLAGNSSLNEINIEILFGQAVMAAIYFLIFIFHSSSKRIPGSFHKAILVLSILAALIFILNNLIGTLPLWRSFNGLSVGFIAIIFYYLLFAILADKQIANNQRTNYLSATLFFLLVSLFVSVRFDNNHFDVIHEELSEIPIYPDSDTWFNNRMANIPTGENDTIVVFLVGANGGGTMQAFWTASVIAQLDQLTGQSFGKHTLLLSGASGGAVGMGIVSSIYGANKPLLPKDINSIYQVDYLSGGLNFLLGRDLVFSALPFNLYQWYNRNSWLREKYSQRLNDVIGQKSPWDEQMQNIWQSDAKIPLYLANTTQVENGKRFVSAGVEIPTDVNGEYLIQKIANDQRTLTLGEAVTLTNRFPYINTAGKLAEYGHFIDGGYYDNSGLESLTASYDYLTNNILSDSCFGDNYVEIHVIHINFTQDAFYTHVFPDGLPRKEYISEANEMAIPALGAYKSILYGQVNARINAIKSALGNHFHQVYLTAPDMYEIYGINFPESTKHNFYSKYIKNPLARTISQNQKNYVDYVLNKEQAYSDVWKRDSSKTNIISVLNKELLPGAKIKEIARLID
jgi:hypothetical protein